MHDVPKWSDTLKKILQHLLQNFWSVSDHFGTLRIKGLILLAKFEKKSLGWSLLAERRWTFVNKLSESCVFLVKGFFITFYVNGFRKILTLKQKVPGQTKDLLELGTDLLHSPRSFKLTYTNQDKICILIRFNSNVMF